MRCSKQNLLVRATRISLQKSIPAVMFSTLGLFHQTACPDGAGCTFSGCLFSHSILKARAKPSNAHLETSLTCGQKESTSEDGDAPRKRRKLSPLDEREPKDGFVVHDQGINSITQSRPSKDQQPVSDTAAADILDKYKLNGGVKAVRPTRPISPPALRHRQSGDISKKKFPAHNEIDTRISHGSQATNNLKNMETTARSLPMSKSDGITPSALRVHKQPPPSEPLNPRSLPSPPATHAVRLKFCQLLQEQYIRLNNLVINSDHPFKLALTLSPQEIITKTLDEEEKTAKSRPSLYANVLKSNISALKKMHQEAYLRRIEQEMLAEQAGENREKGSDDPIHTIRTGLSEDDERKFLKYMVAKPETLAQYNYITSMPSELETKRASEAVETSQNYEQCDRCKSRFQVFPGRRQGDGALTTGGECIHHASNRTHRSGTQLIHNCCNEEVGKSRGCTSSKSHVYKVDSPARLAAVFSFVETPRNPKIAKKGKKAIALDCEMGYTTKGFELIRLTAVDYPSGKVIIDTLVRPEGEILDLNSAYSGIYPNDFASAIELDEHITPIFAAYRRAIGRIHRMSWSSKSGTSKPEFTIPKTPLPLCTSIDQARRLLFEHISSNTPIIGHALHNDMNVLRIIHPTIIDTAILYPHQKAPQFTHSLKNLMLHELNKEIQTGKDGHDSCEDARSAMQLVRCEMAARWKKMRDQGWILEEGRFRDPTKDSDTDTSSDESDGSSESGGSSQGTSPHGRR